MNPFRKILSLSLGDFVAKALSFLAFVYLARVLGVDQYGAVEFALAVLAYLLLMADGGLELWATRETAQGGHVGALIARVLPLRLGLAVVSVGLLWMLLPLLPDLPGLTPLLQLFALTLFAQVVDLRWVFMGREEMRRVAVGLMLAQIVFAGAVFAVVRGPEQVLWVPILRLAGNLAMAGYFFAYAIRSDAAGWFRFSLRGARHAMGPALTLGTSRGLALLSYNFDTVLLGFLIGSAAVGWYNAAYRPVSALLAASSTYFLGLFPILSRTLTQDRADFMNLTVRSFRLTSILAVPVAVGGTFLAEPIVLLLYGGDYVNAIPALQVLAWSAGLVFLRGTYRQALCAAGELRIDLVCAGVATAANIGLNFALIPHFGIVGAAAATAASEVIWVTSVGLVFARRVGPVHPLRLLGPQGGAGLLMAGTFVLATWVWWPFRAAAALGVYVGGVAALGGGSPRRWVEWKGA